MSKAPPRAIDLARMASEAAKAELLEAQGPAGLAPLGAARTDGRWQPASLNGFQLQPAMAQALQEVVNHLTRALYYEGLSVSTPTVTDIPHTVPKDAASAALPHVVEVNDGQNGRLVRGYSTPAVLSLFANQQQRNGIVVDGQI